MLYILDQRLRAQSIPDEKARKGKFTASVGFFCNGGAKDII